jgi:hypothetical protein
MCGKETIAILFVGLQATLLHGQTGAGNYPSRWKKIDSLLSVKELTQSALKEVNALYLLAKKEKNDPQLIKSLVYRLRLEEITKTDAAKLNIYAWEKEASAMSQPASAVLTSILADEYWNYYNQNQWKISKRSSTEKVEKGDIDTWNADDFRSKISSLFLRSLQADKILKQTPLERFDPVIVKGNCRLFRPTLFDLLAHRALTYFQNEPRPILRPTSEFEADNKVIFADKSAFVGYSFDSKDSLSALYRALQLFQRLIDFHLRDPKPDALLDVDIERLVFARRIALLDDKEDLYKRALIEITSRYKDEPSAAQAWYLQAQIFNDSAITYLNQVDSAGRLGFIRAVEICESVIQQKDSSAGKSNCEQMLEQIQRKNLSLQTEKVNIPDQAMRMLVSYRNLNHFYFRVFPLDAKIKDSLVSYGPRENYWRLLVQVSALKSYDLALPDPNDFCAHSTEVKLDGLSPGEYGILASGNANFESHENPLAFQVFYVSRIGFIYSEPDYFVLDRETGQPLSKTSVKVWYQYRDNKQHLLLRREGENFITDKNGSFAIFPSKTNNNNSLLLEFSRPGDHLFIDDSYIYPSSNDPHNEETYSAKTDYESTHMQTILFTDRSIYRPGQIVYFKGIETTKDFITKQSKILPAYKTSVSLYGANGAKLDSLSVLTNEFGSYSGHFLLPENQLTGRFTIKDDMTGDLQYFSVEMYKRPTFYVTFDPPRGSYHFQEDFSVSGMAKSYAGNTIDGARVSYRIVRQMRNHYPPIGRRMPALSFSQEIAHGQTTSDKNGIFSFHFLAKPDRSIAKELNPVFEYTITAEVTEVSGETENAEQKIPIGYQSLALFVDFPSADQITAARLGSLQIRTENLSGNFEPAKVDLAIYPLKSPGRLIRPRFWEAPDQFVMTAEEYAKTFPHDEYSNESNKKTWQKAEPVLNKSDSTRADGKFLDGPAGLKPGWYEIVARTKDKFNQPVTGSTFVEIFDAQTGMPGSPQYLWTNDDRQVAQPGKSVSERIGSSATGLFIIEQNNRKSDLQNSQDKYQSPYSYSFLNLTNELKTIEYPVQAKDRGGFGVSFAFVKDNRFFVNNHWVEVPWSNKTLDISFLSYRDRTAPGSEEKWKVKISGQGGDKASAEVLTSMYDASLDHFASQSWRVLDLFDEHFPGQTWQGHNGFLSSASRNNFQNPVGAPLYRNIYDRLLVKDLVNPSLTLHDMLLDSRAFNAKEISSGLKKTDVVVVGYGNSQISGNPMTRTEKAPDLSEAGPDQAYGPIRKNFNETAFFLPEVQTDSAGCAEFSFLMPEALTQWKWMVFAHTAGLASGYAERMVQTSKQLMVRPNVPRCLREGDKIEFSATLVNQTDSELTGQVQLALIDPTTNQSVDGWFQNMEANQYFTVASHGSTPAYFSIQVPYQYSKPLIYRIIASAPLKGSTVVVSDGEEAMLPVVTNRALVTESLSLDMSGNGSKTLEFKKLLASGNSESLTHQGITVELATNPAWYAFQALPFLAAPLRESSDQIFNRYYANALGQWLAGRDPQIKKDYDRWKAQDSSILLGNLEKNQELKSILLQQTPWVLDGASERDQLKNFALLFDQPHLSQELSSTLKKLSHMQSEPGGFSWFQEGPDDRYITQYILSGIGHLKKLNALPDASNQTLRDIILKALSWLDIQIEEDYKTALSQKSTTTEKLSPLQIQYLYVRSFFGDTGISPDLLAALSYFRKQAQTHWVGQNRFLQAMIALVLSRQGEAKTAAEILAALSQNAVIADPSGVYWKDSNEGFSWYQSKIETQSLLIEAFTEIGTQQALIKGMKTWLLNQKQTQNWKTTTATADACYALLCGRDGSIATNLLSSQVPHPSIKLKIGTESLDQGADANPTDGWVGAGYYKNTISGSMVKPEMGKVNLSVSGLASGQTEPTQVWGSIYWQYFEDLEKITSSVDKSKALSVEKHLFVEKNTDRGPLLEPVRDEESLKIGQKVITRIIIRADRVFEYVHLNDTRASCMEPVNQRSGYKWQDGLGYYESSSDVGSDFFFTRLPKGTYVFEYPLFVNQAGTFTGGLATLQCLYAPEFVGHSQGSRLNVDNPLH